MNEFIAELLSLVELDKKNDELQKQRDSLPRKLAELQANIAAAQKKGEDVGRIRTAAQVERDRLNLELDEEQERIRHYDKRVKEIKNNREYQSLLRELSFAKRVASEAETEVLKRMETIEQTEASIKTAGEELQVAKDALAKAEPEIRDGLVKLDAELIQVKQQREAILGRVPVNVRAHYEMVRRRAPDALAAAANYRCMGCSMSVPPQLFNRLLRMSEFITCPSCQRILYVEVAKPAAEVAKV